MSQYYDRRYEILIDGKPFIAAKDGPTFRCAFDVSINPSDINSTADIRIYNLNDNSVGTVLKRQRTITLRAGYVETIDTIFTGTIINTFQEREGPSGITRLLCKSARPLSRLRRQLAMVFLERKMVFSETVTTYPHIPFGFV